MLEIMMSGMESPRGTKLIPKYTFPVTIFPTSSFISGIGSTESGDLVIHGNNDARSLIYSKNASGIYEHKQTAVNGGITGGYAVPMPGGFVVSTPQWPTGRGALSVWERQADGSYFRTATPREMGNTSGRLGEKGGLASNGDWLFSGINFNGSILVSFRKEAGTWEFKNYVSKPGTSYFSAYCIRSLSATEIVTAASYEVVNGKSGAGAIYVLTLGASGASEKQRIIPTSQYKDMLFGSSITVINSNRFVAVAKNGATSIFYTFDRPNAGSPFTEVSNTVVPNSALVDSTNFVHHNGLLFGGAAYELNTFGTSVVLSIDEAGVIEYRPLLNVAGTENGQNFGALQTVIGDQVFYVSQWRTNTSKNSTVSVYDIQT